MTVGDGPSGGPAQALAQALALHRGGRVADALRAYETLLVSLPDHPDLLHLFGVALTQLGRAAEAIAPLRRAIGLMPKAAAYHARLAEALTASGLAGEAVTAWREVLRLAPDDATACFGLAGLLAAAGRWEEAEPAARRAVELLPDSVPARFRLGLVLEGLGRTSDALEHFLIAGRAAPTERDLHKRILATAAASGAAELAERAVRRLVILRPEAVDGAAALMALPEQQSGSRGRWARRLAAQRPVDGLALALAARQRIGEQDYAGALDTARRAIVAAPALALGYAVRARAATILPDFELAGAAVRLGMCLAPSDPEMAYHAARVEMAIGDLTRGWVLDAQRVRRAGFHRTVALPPCWAGPGHRVERLLVATEQGIGDELLFMSCLPDLLCDAPDPVVELDARFHPLFRRSFPGLRLVPRQAARFDAGKVVFDYTGVARDLGISHAIHAGSLLGLYRGDRARPATREGYLTPDPAGVGVWRQRLATLGPEPTIGICWRSVVHSPMRTSQYTVLDAWEPVLRLPGLRFVSLQYDDCAAEIAGLRDRTGIDLWVPEGLDQMDDLDGTASLIAALDAVVSAPTTVCMLAAALGRPTLRVAQSTYSIGRSRDHFFPTMVPLSPWGRPLDLDLALSRAVDALRRQFRV